MSSAVPRCKCASHGHSHSHSHGTLCEHRLAGLAAQRDPMPLYVAFPPNRLVSAKLCVFIDWGADLMAVHAPVVGRRTG